MNLTRVDRYNKWLRAASVIALAVLLSVSGFRLAFAADPLPGSGNLVVRGRILDNHGDPLQQKVIFSLREGNREIKRREATSNAEGYYEFPSFYIKTYLGGNYKIHLSTYPLDGSEYFACDGVLVHDFTVVNHGTVVVHVVDNNDNPVQAGIPFWLTSKNWLNKGQAWPESYPADGDVEHTTDSDGTISVFISGGVIYPYGHSYGNVNYNQTGTYRYSWDENDGVNLPAVPNQTTNVTVRITPLGKVSFEALTPWGQLAAGLSYSYPTGWSGCRYVENLGDGTLSLYAPATGPVTISGVIPGDPLTGNMGYRLPETAVNVTAWGHTSASETVVATAPGAVAGTVYRGNDLVEGATVQILWRPNHQSPLTLLHEAQTDAGGEFTVPNVVPSEVPYTVRAVKGSERAVSPYPAYVRTGSTEAVDLYVAGDSTPPARPAGLSVENPADASGLILSWTANTESDLASYSVYRSSTELGTYTLIAQGVTVNTYKDTGASLNQEYWYAIGSVDTVGNESEMSEAKSGILTGTTIAFAKDSFLGHEGTSASIVVTRGGDLSTVVTVNYATADDSAIAGEDYVATTGTLTFQADQTSTSFNVTCIDDELVEGNETLTLVLSDPGGGAVLGVPSVATITILDNDHNPPTTSIMAPADGGFMAGEAVTVTGTAASTAGLSRVELCLGRSDGDYWSGSEWTGTKTWLAASGTQDWSFSLTNDGPLTAEGVYTIEARAVDVKDQIDPSPPTASFTYDTNVPTIQFDTPTGGATVAGSQPEVTVSASDSASGIAFVSFAYSVDGNTWTTLPDDNTPEDGYKVSWGAVHLEAGEVTVRATVRDRAGHTSTAEVAFNVVAAPPGNEETPPDEEAVPPGPPSGSLEGLRGASNPSIVTVLSSPGGDMTLSVPAGASDRPVNFSMTALPAEEAGNLLRDAETPTGFTSVGRVFEFTAKTEEDEIPVTSFDKPLTFALELSADELAGISDPLRVGLYRLNDDGSLTFIGGKLIGNRLVVELSSFSRYLIGEMDAAFGDIEGHWGQADIELMASRWVVRGRESGLFDPDATVTRAEFAAMLSRAMLLKPASSVPGFSDVGESDPFYDELASAYGAGLITGYDDGTFRPNAPVTREEMAAMMARALRVTGKASLGDGPLIVLATYSDVGRVSSWALGDLALAIEQGIVRGVSDRELDPAANATRAQAAAMIARFWLR